MAIPSQVRKRIKWEAGFRCAIPTCLTTSPLDVHHIIPQSEGGNDEPSNLIYLCKNCHYRYHNGEIDRDSIKKYKRRLEKMSADLLPHHYRYLHALSQGENVELPLDERYLIEKLERDGHVKVTIEGDPPICRLDLTEKGEDFTK